MAIISVSSPPITIWGLDEACMHMYNVPGKVIGLRSTRGNQTLVVEFVFKQPTQLRYDHHDVEQQKQLLASVFTGKAWEVSRLMEKMHTAPDLYFDAVSQILHAEMVTGTSGAAGRCRLLPGTALRAGDNPGYDGCLYSGWKN